MTTLLPTRGSAITTNEEKGVTTDTPLAQASKRHPKAQSGRVVWTHNQRGGTLIRASSQTNTFPMPPKIGSGLGRSQSTGKPISTPFPLPVHPVRESEVSPDASSFLPSLLSSLFLGLEDAVVPFLRSVLPSGSVAFAVSLFTIQVLRLPCIGKVCRPIIRRRRPNP